jgi:hypothetical protein
MPVPLASNFLMPNATFVIILVVVLLVVGLAVGLLLLLLIGRRGTATRR